METDSGSALAIANALYVGLLVAALGNLLVYGVDFVRRVRLERPRLELFDLRKAGKAKPEDSSLIVQLHNVGRRPARLFQASLRIGTRDVTAKAFSASVVQPDQFLTFELEKTFDHIAEACNTFPEGKPGVILNYSYSEMDGTRKKARSETIRDMYPASPVMQETEFTYWVSQDPDAQRPAGWKR